MELKVTKNKNILSNCEKPGNSTFYLASRLLTEVLAGTNETVGVMAKAENVFYDPQTKIQTMGAITVQIIGADLTESGVGTELSMSGAVESDGSVRCKFTLYFLFKQAVAVSPPPKNRIENLSGASFVLEREKSYGSLHDSLFNLSISRVKSGGKHFAMGEGRGFLVFGNGLA